VQKRSRPIVEIAGEYDGKLKVTDLASTIVLPPQRSTASGIPNLIILKGGAVKEQIVGAVPKQSGRRHQQSLAVEV
jgi:hypothetical protein